LQKELKDVRHIYFQAILRISRIVASGRNSFTVFSSLPAVPAQNEESTSKNNELEEKVYENDAEKIHLNQWVSSEAEIAANLLKYLRHNPFRTIICASLSVIRWYCVKIFFREGINF
jgi:hypothetical protein